MTCTSLVVGCDAALVLPEHDHAQTASGRVPRVEVAHRFEPEPGLVGPARLAPDDVEHEPDVITEVDAVDNRPTNQSHVVSAGTPSGPATHPHTLILSTSRPVLLAERPAHARSSSSCNMCTTSVDAARAMR